MIPVLPRILICMAVLLGNGFLPAVADLRSPAGQSQPDSLSVRLRQGVEFTRLVHYFADRHTWSNRWTSTVRGRWYTDWQQQRGSTSRIRQDGSWYAGISRPVQRNLQVWIAGEGEHFDDRPVPRRSVDVRDAEFYPKQPELESPVMIPGTESASATRILRGGAGVTMNPAAPLTIHTAAGIVDDRRIGQHTSGFGAWSQLELDHWKTGGFQHDGSFNFKSESPKDRYSMDLLGRYRLYREFFPGNTNRLQLSAGLIERDVYRGSALASARRRERQFLIQDDLTYEIARNVSVSMSGDLQRESTDLGESNSKQSELEEQQAGLAATLKGTYRQSTGLLSLAVRTVSQTVRGEILIGRKSEVSFAGTTRLPDHSNLGLRLAVSKYVLDTRSDRNFDDRDELGYRGESKWTKSLFGSLIYELRALVHLDHLVYLFKQNSANNRWTRFLLLSSRLRHQPYNSLFQEFRFAVSANYQAYDFEFNSRSTRSTVFRRVVMGDSISVDLDRRHSINTDIEFQIEELGRLYWDEFEEARSDETKSWHIASVLSRKFSRTLSAAAGYMWDRRWGDQFPAGTSSSRQRFQDLNSYGPIASIALMTRGGFFLQGDGRALQQYELNIDARRIISGEITGGYRW